MTSSEIGGAPAPQNRQVTGWGSADQGIALTGKKARADSPSITFSGVATRALENRPENEDRLRGVA